VKETDLLSLKQTYYFLDAAGYSRALSDQGASDMKEIRTKESLNSIHILGNQDHANKSSTS